MNRNRISQFLNLVNGNRGTFDKRDPNIVNAIFRKPVKFEQAVKTHAAKTVLPLKITTTEAQERYGADFFRRSFVISQVERARRLSTVNRGIGKIIAGTSNPIQVRQDIDAILEKTNYRPPEGKEGTIQDLGTKARQNILIRTNVATIRGYAQAMLDNDPTSVDQYPAWELVRDEVRVDPRGSPSYPAKSDGAIGWPERWQDACEAANDDEADRVFNETGRMIALKSSDVWQQLGSLWDDSLGNAFPPFAWDSGMGTREIRRRECVELGLIRRGEPALPAELPGLNETFEQTPDVEDEDVMDTLLETLTGMAVLKKGVLELVS